jgi:molybdopterin converting factor small subunit
MICIFHGPMRRLVGFRREVYASGGTVHEALVALCASHPELRAALFDATGKVRGVHRLALNQDMLAVDELERPVTDRDVLEVVTALAGG